MLDKDFARDALKIVIQKTHLNGAKSDAQKFLKLINKKDRYRAIFNIGTFAKYEVNGNQYKIKIKDLLEEGVDKEKLLDQIAKEFAEHPKHFSNKWALKILDMIVHGMKLISSD